MCRWARVTPKVGVSAASVGRTFESNGRRGCNYHKMLKVGWRVDKVEKVGAGRIENRGGPQRMYHGRSFCSAGAHSGGKIEVKANRSESIAFNCRERTGSIMAAHS